MAILCIVIGAYAVSLSASSRTEPARNLGFEEDVGHEGTPVGWWTPSADSTPGFTIQRDSNKVREGRFSAKLDVEPVSPDSAGNLIQSVPAKSFRGKRVRFSGYLAVEDVRVANRKIGWDGAFLWLRVDDVNYEALTLANMAGKCLGGTRDWQQAEVVVQVSEDAEQIFFGVMLTAPGTVWADDLRLEVVDDSVPTTAIFDIAADSEMEPSPPLSDEELSSLLVEMKPKIEDLRGLQFKEEVAVGIHSTEELLDSMKAAMQHENHAELMSAMQDAMLMLGVLEEPIALSDILTGVAKEVAGYYDYLGTKKLYIMDSYNRGPLSEYVLAHELVHALEDQHFDLGTLHYGSVDGMEAQSALIEGSATILGNAYLMNEIMQRDNGEAAREFMNAPDMFSGEDGELPPAMQASLMFTYFQGARFLARDGVGMSCPSKEDWQHVWNHPPTSTEQILHPEKYWDPEKRDDPKKVDLPDLASSLGEGWSLTHEDVWGEFTLYYLVADHDWSEEGASQALLSHWVHPASSGWGGDCAQIYKGPEGEQVLVWATLWDTHEDREEFLDAIAEVASRRIPYFRGAYVPAEPHGRYALVFLSTQEMPEGRKRLWEALREADSRWK